MDDYQKEAKTTLFCEGVHTGPMVSVQGTVDLRGIMPIDYAYIMPIDRYSHTHIFLESSTFEYF